MWFLFAFCGNYGSILPHFRDKARYWSKILIFFIPPLGFDAHVVQSAYWHPDSYEKTIIVGLPEGERTLNTCIIV